MTPAAHCSAAPLGKERRKGRILNSPEWRKKALRMYFRMRIGLGKHVDERKNEVVRVPMIVELALIVIKRGIRALRISVQNPDHPLISSIYSTRYVHSVATCFMSCMSPSHGHCIACSRADLSIVFHLGEFI